MSYNSVQGSQGSYHYNQQDAYTSNGNLRGNSSSSSSSRSFPPLGSPSSPPQSVSTSRVISSQNSSRQPQCLKDRGHFATNECEKQFASTRFYQYVHRYRNKDIPILSTGGECFPSRIQELQAKIEQDKVPVYLDGEFTEFKDGSDLLFAKLVETSEYVVGVSIMYANFGGPLKVGPKVLSLGMAHNTGPQHYPDLSNAMSLEDCRLDYEYRNNPPEGSLKVCKGSSLKNLRMENIKEPPNLDEARMLEQLWIRDSNLLKQWPNLSNNQQLQFVDFDSCNGVKKIPDFRKNPQLVRLWLGNNEQLQGPLFVPKSIKILVTVGCKNMEEVPDLSHVTDLQVLAQIDAGYYHGQKQSFSRKTNDAAQIVINQPHPEEMPEEADDSKDEVVDSLANTNIQSSEFPAITTAATTTATSIATTRSWAGVVARGAPPSQVASRGGRGKRN